MRQLYKGIHLLVQIKICHVFHYKLAKEKHYAWFADSRINKSEPPAEQIAHYMWFEHNSIKLLYFAAGSFFTKIHQGKLSGWVLFLSRTDFPYTPWNTDSLTTIIAQLRKVLHRHAQQTRDVETMLIWCCAAVSDVGTTLNQHWVHISGPLGAQRLFWSMQRIQIRMWNSSVPDSITGWWW